MTDDGPSGTSAAAAVDLTPVALLLGRYFASLELAHDAGPLTRLGAGRLRLDLRQRQARHGERSVPFPSIGERLRHRLAMALAPAASPVELRRAELDADVKLTIIPRPDLADMSGGWAGDDGPLVRYEVALTTYLATDTGQWQAEHRGVVTWPETWGKRP